MTRIVVVCAVLAGCANSPDAPIESRFQRLQWASTSVHEAEAQCLADVQRNPTLSFTVCMRSKGWQER